MPPSRRTTADRSNTAARRHGHAACNNQGLCLVLPRRPVCRTALSSIPPAGRQQQKPWLDRAALFHPSLPFLTRPRRCCRRSSPPIRFFGGGTPFENQVWSGCFPTRSLAAELCRLCLMPFSRPDPPLREPSRASGETTPCEKHSQEEKKHVVLLSAYFFPRFCFQAGCRSQARMLLLPALFPTLASNPLATLGPPLGAFRGIGNSPVSVLFPQRQIASYYSTKRRSRPLPRGSRSKKGAGDIPPASTLHLASALGNFQ